MHGLQRTHCLIAGLRTRQSPMDNELYCFLTLACNSFLMKTTAEWEKIFEEASLPFSPINKLKQICEDPHIKYRNMLVEIDQPVVGKMRIAN